MRQRQRGISESLREELLRNGASVVGFADVTDALKGDIAHLRMAVSIGVNRNLNGETIMVLSNLQKRVIRYLRSWGYRYLCIPPDSDRQNGSFISRLYPLFTHKIAATSSGIGWIGKNGLLISFEYGPRLSLATVLTDAPLVPDRPIEFSQCGSCSLCRDYCPSKAITGNEWSRNNPYIELVRKIPCNMYKKRIRATKGKPNCGLCINICPYGRRGIAGQQSDEKTNIFSLKRQVGE